MALRDRHSSGWLVVILLSPFALQTVGCAARALPHEPIQAVAPLPSPTAHPQPETQATQAARNEPQALESVAFGALNLSGDLGALRAGLPVAFLLRGPEPLRLSRQIARVHPELERTEAGVLIEAGKLPAGVVRRYREPSFLIDSDHPILRQISRTLHGECTPTSVRERVAAQFQRPAYGEFWRASYAAAKREGDCTEHAVVAAAIARRLGRPARVVVGYALLTDGRRGVAIGHAWTEIHDGEQWQQVDATPLADQAAAYLVMGEVSDEGRGYQRSLAQLWALLNVSGIEVLPRPGKQ